MSARVVGVLVCALASVGFCAALAAQQPDRPTPPPEPAPEAGDDDALRRELEAMLEAARARRDGRAPLPDARAKLVVAVDGWRDLIERGDRLPGRVVHHALDVLTRLVVEGEPAAMRATVGPAAEALAHCYAPRPRGYARLVARTLARAALLEDRGAKAALLARGLVACLVGAEPVQVERVGRGLAALGGHARPLLPTLERIAETLGDDGAQALDPALAAIRRAAQPTDAAPPPLVFEATVRTVDQARGVVVLALTKAPPVPIGAPFLVVGDDRIVGVGVVDERRSDALVGTIVSAAGPDAIAPGQRVLPL